MYKQGTVMKHRCRQKLHVHRARELSVDETGESFYTNKEYKSVQFYFKFRQIPIIPAPKVLSLSSTYQYM
jgi:hypothetical protein